MLNKKVGGLLVISALSLSASANPVVTTVEGGNQATINAELSNVRVLSIREEKAGTVFDVARNTPGLNPVFYVWNCNSKSPTMAIPVNTLKTAHKNSASVNVKVQATFKDGRLAVYCLTDAELDLEGLTSIVQPTK